MDDELARIYASLEEIKQEYRRLEVETDVLWEYIYDMPAGDDIAQQLQDEINETYTTRSTIK